MTARRFVELGVFLTIAALVSVLGGACAGDRDQTSRRGQDFGSVGGETSLREPSEDGRRCPRDDSYVEESLDTSGDNVSDVRKVYRVEGEAEKARKILVCRELDLNHDGRKDIFRFYNEEGRPNRELIDADFDGTIDSIAFFESGRIVRQESDRNHDGRADETRYFIQGKLLRVDRDDNNDGEVDVWEHWDQGSLVRIGYDINRDKVADFWHRAPPTAEEEADFQDSSSESDDGEGSGG